MDLMTRNENVLILDYNTLRLIDYCIQLEIYDTMDISEPIRDTMAKILLRKEKSMAKFNNVDEDTLNKIIDSRYPLYYKLSPRTPFYDIVETLSHQKFVTNISVLHKNKNVVDGQFNDLYYDGSIEELEDIIKTKDITAVCMDDVDILHNILIRNNVNVENMSFFISKIGYNFVKYNGQVFLKNEDAIMLYSMEKNFDFAVIDLYNFKSEVNDNGNQS